jgi:hypothetical protein
VAGGGGGPARPPQGRDGQAHAPGRRRRKERETPMAWWGRWEVVC